MTLYLEVVLSPLSPVDLATAAREVDSGVKEDEASGEE
jgi:hypothetical protein